MSELEQNENLITGSQADIDALAQKKQASILAISDSHGKRETVRHILKNFAPQCDMLAFCGDGISDIAYNLELSKRNKRSEKNFPRVAAIVRGNGDEDSVPVDLNPPLMSKEKNIAELQIPRSIHINVAGKNVFITHGNNYSVSYGTETLEQYSSQEKSDLVLFGHTHLADRIDSGTTCLINPGSCSLPRHGLPPSFALIQIPGDQEKISCTFFEIKVSLSNGISYEPFSPAMRRKW